MTDKVGANRTTMAACCDAPSPEELNDGSIVCDSCGKVIGTVELRTEVADTLEGEQRSRFLQTVPTNGGLRGSMFHNASYDFLKTRNIEMEVKDRLTRLKLGQYADAVLKMFWATEKAILRSGRTKVRYGPLSAACVWLNVRRFGLSTAVDEVMVAFEVTAQHLKRALNLIQKHTPIPETSSLYYNFETYLDKVCHGIAKRVKSPELEPTLRKRARIILDVARRGCFHEGKNPAMLAAAAACLAYEAHFRKKAPPGIPEHAAGILAQEHQHVSYRYIELKDMLTTCAKVFPFFTDEMLKPKMFHRSLSEIIDVLGEEERTRTEEDEARVRDSSARTSSGTPMIETPPVVTVERMNKALVPPTFAINARKTEYLTRRIKKAKIRINQFYYCELSSCGESSADEDTIEPVPPTFPTRIPSLAEMDRDERDHTDKRIEQLLLDEYSDQQILSMGHRIHTNRRYDPTLPPSADILSSSVLPQRSALRQRPDAAVPITPDASASEHEEEEMLQVPSHTETRPAKRKRARQSKKGSKENVDQVARKRRQLSRKVGVMEELRA
ncbi:uncharacterized protein EV422DRAFT_619780 [Fimicolochytrium jonesii]|uniref:uncharacterized protein n=1 Tax=Fimicolochytrium jonesii TaxID=1396493 RepID=UPI0022FDB175|nr:uncharacterized protein EV422DRAFT_619780 [Fimicolochytrium jonesii]KAI8821437.1 hypothetical protein EV422DRAFT_619780 [Fimicolochytrium jonesii]